MPFGKHAFFPGELRHTNELMVHLGGGYRAECTAAHAAGILSRRMAVIDRDIAQVQAEMQGLHDRLAVAGAELGGSGGGGGGGSGGGRIQEDEGAFEIRETYEESEALLRSAAAAASASGSTASQPVPVGRHRPAEDRVGAAKDSDLDRVFARMAELELLEAQQEEEEALQGGSSSEGVRALDAATAEGGQGSSFPDMQAMFAPVPFLGRADGAQQRPSMAAAAAAAPLTVTRGVRHYRGEPVRHQQRAFGKRKRGGHTSTRHRPPRRGASLGVRLLPVQSWSGAQSRPPPPPPPPLPMGQGSAQGRQLPHTTMMWLL